ncbi:hypothetical protein [Methylobacterium platani]|uniref:Uncharacterized protein n=2 Tax=Methylobacterium platani TaxID=427683 RepID=A0A179SEI1_9HYPH|nr:hypothetical protein [Methylobacterium platani]KMO15956.1 hypothetical protein SQ03_15925 [Methylobacterium platani JCM 14648]OAS24896.1 hypothetical protein A5481_12450 [Methylobacterium platani]
MRLMRFFAAVMKAALAAMAAVPRLIWDGARWVARAVTGAPPAVAAAQAEAMAEIEAAAQEQAAPQAKPAATPAAVHEAWGRAAVAHLAPLPGQPPAATACLDDAARRYLDTLTPAQALRLASMEHRHVGAHLLGDRPLAALPKPLTMAEWRKEEMERLGAKATPRARPDAEPQRGRREASHRLAPAFAIA